MVRKVELDLLEEADSLGTGDPIKEEEPLQKEKSRRYIQWLMQRKIILAVLLVSFSGIIGVSLLMFSAKKDVGIKQAIEFAGIGSIHENIENLDRFVVELRDDSGHYRVLVCDIAIVMDQGKKISASKTEMRNKAYNALKNKGKYVLTSSKAYGTIKKELRDEFDGLLGGGIREVYFTKFIVL